MIGVPGFTNPPSTTTPTTMGSLALNTQSGRIRSLQGNTAIFLYSSLFLSFNSYKLKSHFYNYADKTVLNFAEFGTETIRFLVLCFYYHYLSVLHEVVKQVVNDVRSEDPNADTIRHLLCFSFHPYIKCQNHRPPVKIHVLHVTRKLLIYLLAISL